MKNVFATLIRPVLFAALWACAPWSAFGQGNDNPTGVSGIFNGNSNTGCSYDPYTANATRTIPDITVASAVGAYPLQWSRTMNSRGVGGFLGAGGAWRHSYQWSLAISGDATSTPDNYIVSYPDGPKVTFGSRVGLSYKGPSGVTDRFTGASGTGDCYLLLSDGGQVKFHQTGRADPDGGGYNFTLDPPTQILDPNGLPTTLTYDTSKKLIQVTEPAGRWLKIYYNTSGTFVGLISEVDAGYGAATYTQIVTYDYQRLLLGTLYWNVLWHANYSDSSTSIATYTYQAANDSTAGAPLIKTCADLRYPGPMKNIAYTFVSGGFHGQFASEKHYFGDATAVVSYNLTTHTETRGDGPIRTFTYSATLGTTGITKPYLRKTVTDFIPAPNRGTTVFSYDANGYVSSIQDAQLHTTTFTRLAATGAISTLTRPTVTGQGVAKIQYFYMNPTTGYYLDHVTDELNHTTTYHRNTDMTPSSVDYPDGGVESFLYNGYNQVTSHTMVSNANGTSGGTETFTYDTGGRGLLTKYTPPAGTNGATNYTYDVNDHLGTIKDGRENTTTLGYNQIGQVTIIQYVDGTLVGYSYNPDGTLSLVNTQFGLDPNDPASFAATNYTYDDYKRLKTIVRPLRYTGDPSARTTTVFYDAAGNGDDYTHTDSNATFTITPALVRTANLYDEDFRLLTTTLGENVRTDSVPITTSYTYDKVGNVLSKTDPSGQPGGTYPGTDWSYTYDARDRLLTVDDPTGANKNNLGHTINYTYDLASNKKSEQRANDQTITYDTYDAMNRLTKMTIPQGTTASAITSYSWTKAGKLDIMTDPLLKVYNYDYDTLNRLIKTTYPADSGNVIRTEAKTYDPAGNLATFKNRAGNTQTFAYDTRNRETRYDWDDGVTPARTMSYNNASSVLTCNDGNANITRVYYNDQLLKSETESINNYGDGIARTVTLTYDGDGRRATTTYPSGKKYSSGYTGRGELRTLYDITNGTTTAYQAYYIYNQAGNLTTRRLNSNQTYSSALYNDALNRLSQVQHFLVGSSPKFNYGYDEMSRRVYEQRDGLATAADGFGYDANSELISFIRDGTLSGGTVTGTTANTHTLAYDASGNRRTAIDSGVTTNYGTANNLNQYPVVGSLLATYDGNGNLKTYNGWTYTYDAMNRLTSALKTGTSAYFWYDGFNRICTWQSTGGPGVRFNVWDGWNLIEDYNYPDDSLNTTYLYGAGSDELVSVTRSGATSYFFQDGRGNLAGSRQHGRFG